MKAEILMLAHRLQIELMESFNGAIWVSEKSSDGIAGSPLGRCVPYAGDWITYDNDDNIVSRSCGLYDAILDAVSSAPNVDPDE